MKKKSRKKQKKVKLTKESIYLIYVIAIAIAIVLIILVTPAESDTDTSCRTRADCRSNQFCEYPNCLALTEGKCVGVPGNCPEVYEPVCGCDGETYSNDCFRRSSAVSKNHDGECRG
jgi:hypothetical protein